MSKVSDAFRYHHRQLAEELAQHTAALTGGASQGDPEPLVRFLRRELLPHATGEERSLYPVVEPLLKAHGMATATMRMDHRAIERYIQALERAAADARDTREAGRAQARRDLARLAWQLQAVFEVHLEKEEQIYLPLLERYVSQTEQQDILADMHETPPSREPRRETPPSMSAPCRPPAATPSFSTRSMGCAPGRLSRS